MARIFLPLLIAATLALPAVAERVDVPRHSLDAGQDFQDFGEIRLESLLGGGARPEEERTATATSDFKDFGEIRIESLLAAPLR